MKCDTSISKPRKGSYFPSFLGARRTSNKALIAVTQAAYAHGVPTRPVDELAKAMGLAGVSPTASAAWSRPPFAQATEKEAIARASAFRVRLRTHGRGPRRRARLYVVSQEHWSQIRSTNPREPLKREFSAVPISRASSPHKAAPDEEVPSAKLKIRMLALHLERFDAENLSRSQM